MSKDMLFRIISGFLFTTLVLPGISYGYLDPGTGSMILQILVGTAATGIYFFRDIFRMLWYRVKGKEIQNVSDKKQK